MKREKVSEQLKSPHVLRAIRSFIPDQVFERIARNPNNLDRIGERRTVTVLFVDIAGFTPFCEKRDAEDVMILLNDLFSRILEPVSRYGGTVDKFMGDAAMILFGAPVVHEDDPERAIGAALEIMDRVAELSGVRVSIGVNTGMVVAGIVGNDEHREYTVIGDAVNTASRLESAAAAGEILVGPETFARSASSFRFGEPKRLSLKGKSSPIEARAVLGRRLAGKALAIPPLIGRKRVFQRLSRIADRRGGSALLLGEAGSGKTTLIAHLRERAEKSGVFVLPIEGAPWGENIPYGPIQPIVCEILGDSPFDEFKRLLPKKTGLFPLLSGILGRKIPPTDHTKYLSPIDKRNLLDGLISELLRSRFRGKKKLLLIDGAENIDPSTARVIGILASSKGTSTVMASRGSRPWMESFQFDRIDLRRLDMRSTAALLRQSISAKRIASKLTDEIFAETGGNPGYIVELTKLLRDTGKLITEHGIVGFEGRIDENLPEGIEGIMAARIDNLPPDAREVVRVGSVLGTSFPARLLDEILGHEIAKNGIAQLVGDGIVEKTGETLRFASKALALAAYESLFIAARKKIHAAAASRIESLFQNEIERFYEPLARHYRIGGPRDKAFIYQFRAGAKQEGRFANSEALHYYNEALSISEDEAVAWGMERELLSAIESAGKLYWYSGDLERVIELNTRARRFAKRIGILTLETDSINRIALAKHELGRFDEAMELYELLISMLKPLESERERMLQALTNYGTLLSDLGRLDEAKAIYLEGLKLADDYADSPGAANLLGNLGWLESQLGNLKLAERYLERSGRIDTARGNLRGQAINAVNLAQLFRARGEKAREIERYNAALEAFERIGDRRGVALCLSNLGDAAREAGDIKAARRDHRRALKIAREIDDQQRIVDAQLGLALDNAEEGNLAAGIKRARKAYEIAREAGDWEGRIDVGIALLKLLRRSGDRAAFDEIKIEISKTIMDNNPSAMGRLKAVSKWEDVK